MGLCPVQPHGACAQKCPVPSVVTVLRFILLEQGPHSSRSAPGSSRDSSHWPRGSPGLAPRASSVLRALGEGKAGPGRPPVQRTTLPREVWGCALGAHGGGHQGGLRLSRRGLLVYRRSLPRAGSCLGGMPAWAGRAEQGACRAAARHTGETQDNSGWDRLKPSQALGPPRS